MLWLLQTQSSCSQKGQKALCFLCRAPTKQGIQSVHLPLSVQGPSSKIFLLFSLPCDFYLGPDFIVFIGEVVTQLLSCTWSFFFLSFYIRYLFKSILPWTRCIIHFISYPFFNFIPELDRLSFLFVCMFVCNWGFEFLIIGFISYMKFTFSEC